MKSYILLAFLISVGMSQIVATTKTICGCTQLINQNDCNTLPGCIWSNNQCQTVVCNTILSQKECLNASLYCEWDLTSGQNGACANFQGCESLTVTKQQECYQQNARCLAYNSNTTSCENLNSITQTCGDQPQATCNYNLGSDGACYWNQTTTTCVAVSQCNQVTNEDQCQYLNNKSGIACFWNVNIATPACQQITNCGQFTTQASCRYYLSSLNSVSMTLCSWNSKTGACIAAGSLSNLGSTDCLTNTAYSYRWLGTASNPDVGICASCQHITLPTVTLYSKSQCQCTQYMNQHDCNSQSSLGQQNGPCFWNTNTNTCTFNSCTNITSQNNCIAIPTCYWNYQSGGCKVLVNCTDLTYTQNGVGCAAQSLYCAGFEPNATKAGGTCVATSSAGSCKENKGATACSSYVSSQGVCRWYNGECIPLKNCNQIQDAVYCSGQENLCKWDAPTFSCQQLTCSSFTTQQSCKYVITSFQESQYQYCKWNNSIGLKGGCENAYSALLQNSQTCVSNTGNTFRWSTNNTSQGMCVSCNINQVAVQTPSSCQCSQLYSQNNCENTGFCTYNTLTSTCQPSQCNLYTNQVTCASLNNCYWGKTGCTTFIGCSSLPIAANQLECVSMNNSCKGITNTGQCQSNPATACSAATAANCNNTFGTDGYCYLSTTGQTTTCVGFSQCSQASNAGGETLCLRNQFSCSWNATTSTCTQVTCANFATQLNCLFYVPNPISSEIIPCSWVTTGGVGKCVAASDILTQLTQATCASSTHNTYSWINIQTQGKTGFCVRCQEQITLPNQCDCTYLSQSDCSQALECYWSNGSCQALQCAQILQQTVCASQPQCAWTNNTCTTFTSCGALTGSTQAQCMSQNVYCVGSNQNICTNTYNVCQSNLTDGACIAALGSDGACYWNSQTGQCVAVSSCNQLPESSCKLRSKSCYWNATTCQSLTCGALYSQFGQCTYFVNLSSINNVQYCTFTNDQCISTRDPQSLTQDQCFANSNKTARWVSNKAGKGVCLSCAANLIPVYSSQLCQCYQYMTQTECNAASAQSCTWASSTSSGTTKYLCIQKTCSNITRQLACSQNTNCYWDVSTTPPTCATFTKCNAITGTNLTAQLCLSYSIQCRGSNTTTCTPNPNSSCSALTTSETCTNTPGSDSVCYWNSTGAGTGSCIPITQCSQITNQKICSYYNNICHSVSSQTTPQTFSCQQLTCSNYTTPASCKYVVTSFVTGQIQQCQWSAGACVNLLTPESLNSANCSANTGFTYRWYPSLSNSSEGYCTKCVLNTLYVPGQCACNQLIYKEDCFSNLQCSWSTSTTTPSCYNKPCNQILQQSICSTNPRCAWSAATLQCQPFTQCSDLSGINSGECASYSIFCAATSTQYANYTRKFLCAPTANQKCSTVTATPTSTTTNEQLNCENTFVSSSICLYNSTTKQCQQITSCSQISSQSKCSRLTHSCVWQPATTTGTTTTTAQCVPATCAAITNQLDCTYVLSTLSTPSTSSVTQCIWQSANGCQPAQKALTTLASTNCYSNSFMMSRWTNPQGEAGYCAPCNQYSSKTVAKSVCSCSSLSIYECPLASPQCTLNSAGTSCITQTCSNIKSQNQCAVNSNCIYLGGVCQTFNSTNTCSNITSPKSSLDCATFSTNCLQFNGTVNPPTCNKLECSKLTTNTNCATVEYCYWGNDKCQTINNCKQITDVALCSLQTNRCQWSVIFNSCITQSCSSYTSQTDCTYVYTSYSQADVALCYWDTFYNDCRSASLALAANFTQSNTSCYVNTGHLYHLDGSDCTRCFQNILSILLITVLLIFI